MDRVLCAAESEARAEPLFATAGRVDRWLLVEQPGPWGPRTLPESGLAEPVVQGLAARAARLGTRTALMRRPGWLDWDPARRLVVAVDCRPGAQRMLTRTVAGPAELAALTPPWDDAPEQDSLRDDSPRDEGAAPDPRWRAEPGPLLAVCTHGRHDLCCAVRGRPVVRALQQAFPDRIVEVSHLGGHRFAPTVLVLPGGHLLGRLGPDDAVEACRAVLAGRRPAGQHYRGRGAYDREVQAALHFAADHLAGLPAGEPALDGLRLRRSVALDGDRWIVELDMPAPPATVGALPGTAAATGVTVTVGRVPGAGSGRLSCGDDPVPAPATYALLDLALTGPSAAAPAGRRRCGRL
ncbi:sucrase ferredoxin [Frankia sp. QA3]|uniref:sucrase ferredoxin n=1 Tax=Frankia sp. QA3 TaxID=710111 RepID=UPI000269C3A1|nr:sucrase ferredoxin [Frankia sp. QA3]EIV93380.1 hypothetical protein FraQA3DRAFT_3072 [Frankia sp. QA3]